MAWAFERSEEYTVKSAYRALVTQNEHRALEEGTVVGTSTSQKKIVDCSMETQGDPKSSCFHVESSQRDTS